MPSTESLRTKKARLTRNALHEAAITRVLEDGLDNATVAAIAADAGVSTRTFFNYYATKEDAIVGLDELSIDEQLVSDYIESDSGRDTLAEDTARFVRHVLLVSTLDPDTPARRRTLFAAHPELMSKSFERMEQLEEIIGVHVRQRLRFLGMEFSSEYSAQRVARMLTLLSMVPIKHAGRMIKNNPELLIGTDGTDTVHEESLELYLKVLNRL